MVVAASVQLVGLFEQSETGVDELGAVGEVGVSCIEAPLQVSSLTCDVAECLLDLGLWERAVGCEVDQVFLLRVQQAAEHRHALVDQLSAKLDERTRNRITPQLQAYSDASRKLAEARSRQEALDRVLFQWDRADDLRLAADQLGNEVQRLRTALELAERQLAERKTEILDELDAEFAETMTAIGVPSVERATINRTSYLPMLNGEIYTKFSPAGGVRTATQLAYWLTLMSVALRRRDTAYPAFLLIDSPRASLNNSDDLAAALYRRIVTQVDAAQD